ncbi:MAG: tyrosine-type recombinase/integrase, partial [Acidimicrobiia bacterium]
MATSTKRRGRGEGGVYLRADGRWCAAVDLGWHDGKRKRKVIYGRTRREVAEKLTVLLPQAAAGNVPHGTAPTVDAWLNLWLAEAEHRVATNTLAHYKRVCDYYVRPALGHRKLDRVRPPDFASMTKGILDKGLSLRTAQVSHQVLGMALRAAVRQGLLTSNPADRVTAPAPRRKALDVVTAPEARKLLAAAQEERYGPLWTLALTSGLRQGEVLALRWADVDFD